MPTARRPSAANRVTALRAAPLASRPTALARRAALVALSLLAALATGGALAPAAAFLASAGGGAVASAAGGAGASTAGAAASPQDLPCVAAEPRETRADSYSFPADRISCYAERTLASDQAFFSGDFHADAGGLTTRYLGAGKVAYQASIEAPACKRRLAGTAIVDAAHPLTAVDGPLSLAFWDNGVELRMASGASGAAGAAEASGAARGAGASGNAGAACPGFAQEYFYDPDPEGTRLAAENWSGSGCDLSSAGLEKPAFLRFYYAFQRAIAADDRPAVAAMVQYPIDAHSSAGWHRRIAAPRQLLSSYSRIFDACLRTIIGKQRVGDLFCRDQGVMFGDGEVWISATFDRDGKPGPLKVVAINGCEATSSLGALADLQVTLAADPTCPRGDGYAVRVENRHGPAPAPRAGLTVETSPTLGIHAWQCTATPGATCGTPTTVPATPTKPLDHLQAWIDLQPDASLTYHLCGARTGPGTLSAAIVPAQSPPHLGLLDVNHARATLRVP